MEELRWSPSPQSRVKTLKEGPEAQFQPRRRPLKVGSKQDGTGVFSGLRSGRRPLKVGSKRARAYHCRWSVNVAVPSKSGQNGHEGAIRCLVQLVAVPSKSGQNSVVIALWLAAGARRRPLKVGSKLLDEYRGVGEGCWSPSPQSRVKTASVFTSSMNSLIRSPSPQSRVKTTRLRKVESTS